MKKIAGALLSLLLSVALITPVHAALTVQAVIGRDVYVAFKFENLSEMIYQNITKEIDESTIPNIILANLRQRNLTHVDSYIGPEAVNFDGQSRSINVTFSLYGSDILNFTVNTKLMTKTYYFRTDWRKFHINITNGILLNFTEYFGKPVNQWQKINTTLNDKKHPAYNYNFTDTGPFDSSFYFILPATANWTSVQAIGDTIIFELPLPFEDSLLNSPFSILVALIVVVIAFSLYRKVRK